MNITLGDGAGPMNTVSVSTMCHPVLSPNDDIKEGVNILLLTIESTDSAICTGRDLTALIEGANDGILYDLCYDFVTSANL